VNDQRLEVVISRLLRTGVILSALVVLLGGVCYLSKHGREQPDYRVFRGTPAEYRTISAVIHAASPSDCRAVIQLGLLLLVLTPVARVAFCLAGFGLERDGTYAVVTSIVLAVLIYSLTPR
jgi:uncharacterized membrane protein